MTNFRSTLRRAAWITAAVLLAACGGDDTTLPKEGGATPEGPGGNEPEKSEWTIRSAAELIALGTLKAGDVVTWSNGTYDVQQLLFTGAGSAEKPIILKAETPGGVCFTGTSKLRISGNNLQIEGFQWKDPTPAGEHLIVFETGSEACRLEECVVTGAGTQMDAVTGTKWVSLYGRNHVVNHCRFEHKRNKGALCVIWLETGVKAGHVISNNRFSRPDIILDPNDGDPANEQETIRIGDSEHSMQDAGCTIENNYFHQCNGEAQEIVSNKGCNNIYRGNGFFESMGTLTLRQGNGCTVSGNCFIGNRIDKTGGIRVIGENHIVENNHLETLNSVGYLSALCLVRGQENATASGYAQVKKATIRNNTFIDCALAMHINYGSSSMTLPVIESRIENNRVLAAAPTEGATAEYVVRYENSSPEAEITWSGNTFFGRFKNNYFELTALKTRPEVTSGKAQMDAIAAAAGTTWK